MVNIDSLINVLPISTLEPAWVASICDLVDVPEDQRWQHVLHFLEPPAGARVPYIDPVKAIETLLRGEGVAAEIAQATARESFARMPNSGAALERLVVYDSFEPETPECLPVPVFVEWLREEWPLICRQTLDVILTANPDAAASQQPKFNSPDVADFFERAVDVVTHAPILRGTDNWEHPYSLTDKPALPPAKAMIEFVPGAPWFDFDWSQDNQPSPGEDADFLLWRESIRPVAEALEQRLGEPVYRFGIFEDELDDDCAHRFLVLHWCCTHKPESGFVQYLVKVSGARDVDELKAALIDPANYHHPFEMNYAFFGIDPIACRFAYPSGERKTVGFVFFTHEAQQAAYIMLRQAIGSDVLLVAPPELLDRAWVDRATANCRSWSAMYQHNHTVDAPITILAQIDRLHVIADRQERAPGAFNLQLSESVENLLWLALQHNMDAHYYTPDRMGLGNPEMSLERRGVPERVAARQAQKSEFMLGLESLRVDCDFCSSGLWDESGRMLSYDHLELPFALVRRIAAWQKDFDDTEMPPSRADDAWCERHDQEQRDIVRELRAVLKDRVKVGPNF